MSAMQDEISAMDFEGTAGNRLVSVVVTGGKKVKSINIDASLLNPNEKGMLEDLILAAFNNAQDKFSDHYESVFSNATAGLNMPGNLPF